MIKLLFFKYGQIQSMLIKINEHLYQVNSLIVEINTIINQHNQNNNSFFSQMNNFIKMINNPINFNENRIPNFNNQNNQNIINPKINITFKLVNIIDGNNNLNNGLVNLILDKEITVNEMLTIFLKKIKREDCINKNIIGFLFNERNLNFGDKNKIVKMDCSIITVYNINNFE